MSVYEELMNEKMPEEGPRRSGDQGGGHSSGRGGVREKPLTPEERAQYEAAQRRAAARKIPYPKGSAGETGEPTQSTRSDASTEHEGPSLKEKVKYLAEIARLAGPGPATDVRRNPGTSEKGKRARRRSSGETHGTSLGAHMLKVTHPETGVNAGTEHEGPSLREKLAYLSEIGGGLELAKSAKQAQDTSKERRKRSSAAYKRTERELVAGLMRQGKDKPR